MGTKVLGLIMAGGKGERLYPLTRDRAKPAVPFGGKYRIVDFVLSNFINSGIRSLYVLTQFKSQSLIEHIRDTWKLGSVLRDQFVSAVPAQMQQGESWYRGTADAVRQNLNLVHQSDPDIVAVFGADHIYRMDVGQMIRFHLERKADVTVAALPVPLQAAKGFGIIEAAKDGRISGFQEKPDKPKPMPGDPERAYSSMGNYIFKTDVLVQALEQDAVRPGSHDFGRNIVPHLVRSQRVLAYNFLDNEIPGLQPYEERGYWRDVGTLEAYWQAHMDILGEAPIFNLRNREWPILTDTYDGPVASFVRSHLDEAMVGQGSHVIDADIRRSVIGRNVEIEPGARVEECVILDGSVIGAKARLRRVIADRFNVIPAGAELGLDPVADRKRYHVTRAGIVALPRGPSAGDVPRQKRTS